MPRSVEQFQVAVQLILKIYFWNSFYSVICRVDLDDSVPI
jgi:hypothetical protein